jgi:hypothetical protein
MLLDLHHPFETETNISDYSMDTMITQVGHPVAFHSVKMFDTVCKYLTYEMESYSIVHALKQWIHYILGKEMAIHTNNNPL